ncbi:MAG TPA: anti-sigma factor [Thermoanaerobaculia bacterium]|nr:anti-sigma factor [Thermoanaerobaculia bacterium]
MSAGHTPRFEEMLPAYALGALEGDELHELEAHLATGCDECRRQLRMWEADLEEIAASVSPMTPSAETRQRVLEATAPATQPAPARLEPRRTRSAGRRGRWGWLAAAAALALVVWSQWNVARLRQETADLAQERDRLARQVTSLQSERDLARAEAQRMAQALGFITSPGVRSIQLAGLEAAPGAAGHTFVDPRRRQAVFYASGLPALAPDQTYQLWFITDRPVSAGTFSVDGSGRGNLQVDGVADGVRTWAVTVEPSGGAPQPTGAMVLAGQA